MHNHPWAVALHALTHLYNDTRADLSRDDVAVESNEALEEESITIDQLLHIIDGLERICDVSYR